MGIGPTGSDHRLFRLENGAQLRQLPRQFRRTLVRGGDHDPGRHTPYFETVRNSDAKNCRCAGGQSDGLVVYHPDPGAYPGIVYYRTGSHDHLSVADQPQVLPVAAQCKIQIRHTGPALCQHLGRRHPDALCRTTGTDGGFPLAVGHAAHDHPFRMEGGSWNPSVQRVLFYDLPQGAGRAAARFCRRRTQTPHPDRVDQTQGAGSGVRKDRTKGSGNARSRANAAPQNR